MIKDWEPSNVDIFWGEIAPCNHVVQIYETDDIFLDALSGFVGGGIKSGDCVILIATQKHLDALTKRLKDYGVRVNTLIEDGRFIALDAAETLNKFMINGWPDEKLFENTVNSIMSIARKNNRRVRAFGEMVALLWAEGNNGATIQLEHLWNKFSEKEKFSLFCAYPKSGFTDDINNSITHICQKHTQVIKNSVEKPLTELFFKNSI